MASLDNFCLAKSNEIVNSRYHQFIFKFYSYEFKKSGKKRSSPRVSKCRLYILPRSGVETTSWCRAWVVAGWKKKKRKGAIKENKESYSWTGREQMLFMFQLDLLARGIRGHVQQFRALMSKVMRCLDKRFLDRQWSFLTSHYANSWAILEINWEARLNANIAWWNYDIISGVMDACRMLCSRESGRVDGGIFLPKRVIVAPAVQLISESHIIWIARFWCNLCTLTDSWCCP